MLVAISPVSQLSQIQESRIKNFSMIISFILVTLVSDAGVILLRRN